MLETTELLTKMLAAGTILGDVFIVILVASLILQKVGKGGEFSRKIVELASKNAFLVSFLISLTAILMSLYYSDVAAFLPCSLCWWQRIFMYPQALILGLAIWKRDENIVDYSLLLSIIGTIIAAYHTFIQFGGTPLIPCSADAAAASCVQISFIIYGYITIPVMSLTGFLLITLFMLSRKITRLEQLS